MAQFPETPAPQDGWAPSQAGPPVQTAYSTESMLADKAAQMSLIFGIVGMFILGIVFGPVAIWQASKAEKLNKAATPGKVLGWISLIWGIGQLFLVMTIFGSLFALSSGV